MLYKDVVMAVERERTGVLDRGRLIDLLTAALADERTGVMLYRQHTGDVSVEMHDTLVASGLQIEEHVRLLERMIAQLGGDSSRRPLTCEPDTPQESSLLNWIARLEAIVAFELRDQILWTLLDRLSRDSLDATAAVIVRPAVQQVESAEALGACNGRRHHERIRWARETMRDLMARRREIGTPRYRTWRVLAGFVLGS